MPEPRSALLPTQWQPGSVGGISKLNDFLSTRLKNFDCDRAKTDRESTSRLSPYIHYGQISVRRIHVMVKQVLPSCEHFLLPHFLVLTA